MSPILLFLGFVGIAASLLPWEASAKEELTDVQLTEATASGLKLEAVETDPDVFMESQIRSLVINNIFGDSNVRTELFIEIGSAAGQVIRQEIVIAQERESASPEEKKESLDERVLKIDSQRNLAKLVVNNVTGSSLVETVINLYLAGFVQGNARDLGLSFTQESAAGDAAGNGAQGSAGGIQIIEAPNGLVVNLPVPGTPGPTGAAAGASSSLNVNIDPLLMNPPTTLSGAASFLETLVPLNSDIAPRITELRRVEEVISTFPR